MRLSILLYFYPIWLPPLLGYMFWESWMRYVRYQFFTSTKVVLLEVRLPREIMKSPAAMELAFNSFYITGGEGTFFARYWEGKDSALVFTRNSFFWWGSQIHDLDSRKCPQYY
jgi:hypothetical protein